MAAPDIAPLIKAVRVGGEDTAVAAVRYVEDETGSVLYLRLVADLPTPENDPVELVDAEGQVLAVCPDITDAVPVSEELQITYGAASVPPSAPQSVPTPPSTPTGPNPAQPPAGGPGEAKGEGG